MGVLELCVFWVGYSWVLGLLGEGILSLKGARQNRRFWERDKIVEF